MTIITSPWQTRPWRLPNICDEIARMVRVYHYTAESAVYELTTRPLLLEHKPAKIDDAWRPAIGTKIKVQFPDGREYVAEVDTTFGDGEIIAVVTA